MEAATEWSTRIVAHNFNGKTFAWPRDPLKKFEINFFRSSSIGVRFSLSHPISFPHMTVQCVASSQTEVPMGFDTAYASGIETIQPSKTVHVKFQLQQECMFGEHFLLVGDDHILGSWNPLNAVPLNWSDGHLWTVELDIPVERSIQFKYLLRRGTGEILWQPGPDRIFRAWETNSTITITEDWANSELQKMTEEEEEITDPTQKLIHDIRTEYDENMISADTIAYPEDKLTVNRNEVIAMESETHRRKENSANAKKDISRDKWKGKMSEKKSARVEPEEPLIPYEGGPVLVPGSNPLPVVSANNAPCNES